MLKSILIKERQSDWMAYISGTAIWECGKTEEEALDKLIVTIKRCYPNFKLLVDVD